MTSRNVQACIQEGHRSGTVSVSNIYLQFSHCHWVIRLPFREDAIVCIPGNVYIVKHVGAFFLVEFSFRSVTGLTETQASGCAGGL